MEKHTYHALCFLLTTACFLSCEPRKETITVSVKNNLDFDRTEIVSIKAEDLSLLLRENKAEDLRVKKSDAELFLPIQWIDYNQDGQTDELLFQASVKADGVSNYEIIANDEAEAPEPESVAYSRFVPERIDDYAWENDKVAFRTFGPEAQRLAEANEPGGTLTSGIDLWLKKVDYPILDKWYKINLDSAGYYHQDHGEGYDPYHVGASRGTGGIGIWEQGNLLVSKNFTAYKTIANGPLRTVFELSYAPWSPYQVRDTKRITLDLGSNFSKFEVRIDSIVGNPNFAIGISLHDNKGEVRLNHEHGWYRHWEQIDTSAFLGEALILEAQRVDTAFSNVSEVKDQSNLLVMLKPVTDSFQYYTGFAWTGSGQVSSPEEWDSLLEKQAAFIKNPLEVSINKNSE